jgi:hypothetical protein
MLIVHHSQHYKGLTYTEAAERGPMVGGDDGARAFALSVYRCIPFIDETEERS